MYFHHFIPIHVPPPQSRQISVLSYRRAYRDFHFSYSDWFYRLCYFREYQMRSLVLFHSFLFGKRVPSCLYFQKNSRNLVANLYLFFLLKMNCFLFLGHLLVYHFRLFSLVLMSCWSCEVTLLTPDLWTFWRF